MKKMWQDSKLERNSRFGVENIYNSGQSGFQLEFHSGCTLAPKFIKNVESIVQSTSATTHSYTIQPTISADGRLLSPLFIVLKEITGTFSPRVQETLFNASNIFVTASKSGKLTSNHVKTWLKEVFFPNVGPQSVLLLDSWSGHCPKIVSETKPDSATDIVFLTIPAGTTGKIQPLDVYGFRLWKNFIKYFSDTIMLLDLALDLHNRNNILKLQSLTHHQSRHPGFKIYLNMRGLIASSTGKNSHSVPPSFSVFWWDNTKLHQFRTLNGIHLKTFKKVLRKSGK
ncbi:uncharacterized protein LOC118644430 [Monomorium pharaonis]|uniref:uncharacterized protein LOC118644430 n=1 Tax=Monomorium pharaonis TaxID=307658 RepID=UPI00174612E6|nr:uncharacterized protein LOC118644430 [Monomorium pharaonis]